MGVTLASVSSPLGLSFPIYKMGQRRVAVTRGPLELWVPSGRFGDNVICGLLSCWVFRVGG